ncbi:MAG: helix-turn-helix domain-containing protein [Paludibacter sp.]|nr:helix-turn-helix domain-containing protein [Paludibacter sp.]
MDFYETTDKKLDKIIDRVSEFAIKTKLVQNIDPENVFFDNQEFMQLMNISKRTAQVWRDTKLIGFCQIGYKIYYRLLDIQNLLKENYNPKKQLK